MATITSKAPTSSRAPTPRLPQPHRQHRGGQHAGEDARGPVHRHGEGILPAVQQDEAAEDARSPATAGPHTPPPASGLGRRSSVKPSRMSDHHRALAHERQHRQGDDDGGRGHHLLLHEVADAHVRIVRLGQPAHGAQPEEVGQQVHRQIEPGRERSAASPRPAPWPPPPPRGSARAPPTRATARGARSAASTTGAITSTPPRISSIMKTMEVPSKRVRQRRRADDGARAQPGQERPPPRARHAHARAPCGDGRSATSP